MRFLIIVLCCSVFIQTGSGQTATYSGADVPASSQFLIVGKVGPNFMVLTSTGWRKKLLVYDANMKVLSNDVQKYMPDDLLGITPIAVGEHLLVTYRYRKKNIIYCDAVKVDAYGKRVSNVERIDSTVLARQEPANPGGGSSFPPSAVLVTGNKNTHDPVSGTNDALFGAYQMGDARNTHNHQNNYKSADQYSVTNSDDKSKILVYKWAMGEKGYSLEAKILNDKLQMLDAFKMPLSSREDLHSPVQIDNDGNIFFLAQEPAAHRGSISSLEMFSKKFLVNNYVRVPIYLEKHILLRPHLKVDNLNKHITVNAFYIEPLKNSSLAGLFTFRVSSTFENIRSVFTEFPPGLSSLQNKTSSGELEKDGSPAFPNMFFILDAYFTRDGSYQLVAGRTSGTRNFAVDSMNNNIPQVVFLNLDSSLKISASTIFTLKQLLEKPALTSHYTYAVFNRGNSLDLIVSTQNVNGIAATKQFKIPASGQTFNLPTVLPRNEKYALRSQSLKQVGLDQVMIPYMNHHHKMGFALLQLAR